MAAILALWGCSGPVEVPCVEILLWTRTDTIPRADGTRHFETVVDSMTWVEVSCDDGDEGLPPPPPAARPANP